MMKQSEAVRTFINQADSQGLTDKARRDFAVENVKIGLLDGSIAYGKDRTDEKAVSIYASSVVGNWLKKDTTLNGGVKYEPATKRGPQVKDEQLIALNANLKSLRVLSPDNMDLIGRVESAIEARKAILAQAKETTKVQSLEDTLASLEAMGI